MSLSSVLEEIKKIKPFVDEDVDSGPVETLQARRGRKKQAIESMKRLRREYGQDLLRSSMFLVVVGGSKDDFVNITSEKYQVMSTDPETFYKDLSNRVPSVLYLGKETISSTFSVLTRHLEDKANELDLSSYPQVIYKNTYGEKINSEEEFKDLVKKIINEQMGSEIVGIQAISSLIDTAIEKNHKNKVTPITLATNDVELASYLMKDLSRVSTRVMLVVAGKANKSVRELAKSEGNVLTLKEVNEETVKEALNKLKKVL